MRRVLQQSAARALHLATPRTIPVIQSSRLLSPLLAAFPTSSNLPLHSSFSTTDDSTDAAGDSPPTPPEDPEAPIAPPARHSVTITNLYPAGATFSMDDVSNTLEAVLSSSSSTTVKKIVDADTIKYIVNKDGNATGMVKVNFDTEADRAAFYDAVHGLPTPHNTLLKIEQPSPVGAFVSVGQSEFADTVVDAFYDSIDFVATDEDAEDWPDLNGKDFEKQFDDFLDIYLEENKRLGRVELGGQEILTKADTLLALDADTIDDEQPAGEVAAFDVSVPQEDVFEGVAQDDMMAMLDEMTYNPDKFEVRRAQMVAEDPALAHFLSGLDDLLESFNSASSGREEREWEDFVEQNSALVPDGVDAPDIDELRDMYNGITKEAKLEDERVKKELEDYVLRDQNKPAGDWAELIVKVDRVQKVTKGGVIMSNRCLVTIGNNKGAGGFGMGKGPSPQEAMTLASRNARKNLVFVDRYSNSALMHDLVGTHNNCKVVLRALPPGMGMTAGPLIREMLEMMGIADCSAKAYGNRNPYSVVRATFKALKMHEGLEVIARKRGKRVMELARAKKLHLD